MCVCDLILSVAVQIAPTPVSDFGNSVIHGLLPSNHSVSVVVASCRGILTKEMLVASHKCQDLGLWKFRVLSLMPLHCIAVYTSTIGFLV